MRYDRVLKKRQFSDALLRRRMRDHPASRSRRVEYFADVINSAVINHKARSSIEAWNKLISLGLSQEGLVFLLSLDLLRTRIKEAQSRRVRRSRNSIQCPNQPNETSASTSARMASAQTCTNSQTLRNEYGQKESSAIIQE